MLSLRIKITYCDHQLILHFKISNNSSLVHFCSVMTTWERPILTVVTTVRIGRSQMKIASKYVQCSRIFVLQKDECCTSEDVHHGFSILQFLSIKINSTCWFSVIIPWMKLSVNPMWCLAHVMNYFSWIGETMWLLKSRWQPNKNELQIKLVCNKNLFFITSCI